MIHFSPTILNFLLANILERLLHKDNILSVKKFAVEAWIIFLQDLDFPEVYTSLLSQSVNLPSLIPQLNTEVKITASIPDQNFVLAPSLMAIGDNEEVVDYTEESSRMMEVLLQHILRKIQLGEPFEYWFNILIKDFLTPLFPRSKNPSGNFLKNNEKFYRKMVK